MKAPAVHLKHFIGASILCLALYLAPPPSKALAVEQVPNPRQIYGGWVTDMADILQPETEAQLNQMINENVISSNRTENPPEPYWNNLWYLLATSGAIGAGILIYLKFHKIFLHPQALSLMRFSWLTPRIYCAECGSKMKQLEPSAISELSNMNLDLMKDTKFQLWQCPHCAQKLTINPFHIRMQSSPTPKLTEHRANHRTKNGSGNWYIGVGSDFSSGYSGGDGGGFGGGNSGGGGAGGDW